MVELLIAEKPSAAKKIAEALADKTPVKKQVGKVVYYELSHKGKKIIIGCAVGHLYALAEKNKNGWAYPTFSYEWKPAYSVSKSASFSKPYIDVLKKIAKNADDVVVCTDYDLEGSVIGFNCVRFICGKNDAKRMKFSTLTKEDLLDSYEHAFRHLNKGMIESGLTRHELDWIWGINLSRALTLSIKNATGRFKILSSGRVQGPALKLIVDREIEIKNFKPIPYWVIQLLGKINKEDIEAWHKKEKFLDKKEADSVIKNTRGKKGAVSDVKKTEFKQRSPFPFDLTTLQMESYRVFGINPKKTLEIAQNLYLMGVISYPRTSNQQLPEALNYKKILTALAKQEVYKKLCNELLKGKLNPNNGKKTDPAHPALHATGEIPESLSDEEAKVYDLIVRRTLATFADDAIRETVEIIIDVNKEFFISKGTRTVKEGWHRFYKYVSLEEQTMPDVKIKDKVEVKKINLLDKETQPPKRYTQASIIKELERRNLGTKSISGDTLVYINGQLISVIDLFKSGEKTQENLLTKIKKATFYNLKEKKIALKTNVLVAKRFKDKNEKMFSIETPFTKLISDSDHKYFFIDNNGVIYTKKASSINIGENLLFTKLNSFGKEIINKDWLISIKRKYRLKEENNFLSYQNGIGFKLDSLPVLESSKLFWLLGYIYGDGSVDKKKDYEGYTINITIDKNETFLIKKLLKTIEDIFGKGCYNMTFPSDKNTIRINLPSVTSYYLIKKFPSLILKSVFDVPFEYQADFIKGYMDSDGNIHLRDKKEVKIKGIFTKSNGTARIKFTLSRKAHVFWIKEMLNLLAINTTTIKEKIASIKNKKYPCYELKISGKNNILLYAIYVGFEHPKKRNILYRGLINNSLQYKQIEKLINSFIILLKNNNKFTKFEDRITYIFRTYEKLGLVERKRISAGYSRKFVIRLPPYLLTKVSNFLLSLYGQEISPWTYVVKVINNETINYDKEDLYDLIVDRENPTFIALGGQIIHNSTRSEIIDTLYQRSYVKDQSVVATKLGIKIVETLNKYCPKILDEELTRHFEMDMELIQESKKKNKEVIEEAKEVLTDILKDFKSKEKKIGDELLEATEETANELNTVGVCKKCGGVLKIMYSPKIKSKFIGCSNYPDCKAVYNLPSNGLIKTTEKLCKDCEYPIIMVVRKGRRPQELCINPECPSKRLTPEEERLSKEERKCSKCGKGKMVLRKSLYGSFLACNQYPKCRNIEKINNNT